MTRLRPSQTSHRWIGLDIGSQAIKLVELEQTGAGPRLIKHLIQELPVTRSEQPVDRMGWLHSALKDFGAAQVHVVLSGPEVVLRRLLLPQMSAKEAAEAVKWQVKDHLPFPTQDAVLDVRSVGDVWEKDVRKQDMLVGAAPKTYVSEILSIVEGMGVRVLSLVPSTVAIWRSVSTLAPDVRQGSLVLVELGARSTQVAIVKDGHVRLVRDIGIGSSHLTESLVGEVASEVGTVVIDRSKAEALKRRYGILRDPADSRTEEGVSLFNIASLMRPVLESLVTELARVFDFYKLQVDPTGVSRVLLCGGGANLKELSGFLADGLGVTVELFNPLIRMGVSGKPLEADQVAHDGPRLAAAIGAALAHEEELNLMPPEIREQRLREWTHRVWTLAAKAIAAVAGAVFVGLGLYSLVLGAQIARHQTAWSALEPSYLEYVKVTNDRDALEQANARVQEFLNEQPVWEGVFKELGALMPLHLQLDEWDVRSDRWASAGGLRFTMAGTCEELGTTGQVTISQFVKALDQSPFFKDVESRTSEVTSQGIRRLGFSVEGLLE